MESIPKVLKDKGSYNTKMEPATKPSNSIISLRWKMFKTVLNYS